MAAVPNTTTFELQDVVDVVIPTTNDLVDCFADAAAENFDPLYEGDKNELLNFRNYQSEANTFLGGVGATSVTSVADMVALSSLATGDIRDFAIDSDNNVQFYAKTTYSLDANAFNGDDNLTYYIDEKGRCTSAGGNALHNATPVLNLVLVLPGLTTCASDLISGGGAGTKQNTDVCCFPKLNPIGTSGSTNSGNFDHLVCSSDVYVHGDNETSNGGAPDPDIASPVASDIGTHIQYSANSNAPDEAVLSTTSKGSTNVLLGWTAVSHSNTIDHYLVFYNGNYFGKTSGTSLDVTGLTASTSYDFKILTIDNQGNSSPFITVHTDTTNA